MLGEEKCMLVKNYFNIMNNRFFVFLVLFFAFVVIPDAYSQTTQNINQNGGQQTATNTKKISSESALGNTMTAAPRMRSTVANTRNAAAVAKKGQKTTSYTTNDFTRELQAAIERFNEEFTNEPITEINDENLSRLIKYGLISRKKMDEYRKLTIINGKVYVKKTDTTTTDTIPTNNEKGLFGEFDQACQAIKENKTRGESTGNVIPKKRIEVKRRVLTFRDKYNKLHSHENYYPVVNMVSPVKITGKRYETLKDFVTSILMKKEVTKREIIIKKLRQIDMQIKMLRKRKIGFFGLMGVERKRIQILEMEKRRLEQELR